MKNIELTIGITSFNRFYYLSSLLDSLALCMPEGILCKIVVADNSSMESDLVKFKEDHSDYQKKNLPTQNRIRNLFAQSLVRS